MTFDKNHAPHFLFLYISFQKSNKINYKIVITPQRRLQNASLFLTDIDLGTISTILNEMKIVDIIA